MQKRVVDSTINDEDEDCDEAKMRIIDKKEAQGDYEQFTRDAAKKTSQTQEAELEEKDAQGDCEQFPSDVAEKPVADSKSIAEKDCADDYGKPVDFCTKSSRWRDARGRFCRPPSPAR